MECGRTGWVKMTQNLGKATSLGDVKEPFVLRHFERCFGVVFCPNRLHERDECMWVVTRFGFSGTKRGRQKKPRHLKRTNPTNSWLFAKGQAPACPKQTMRATTMPHSLGETLLTKLKGWTTRTLFRQERTCLASDATCRR